MRKILVTGANGQLGKTFYDLSLETGRNDIQWDFKSSDELDITDVQETRSFFQNDKYDFLINCAAYTAVDLAEDEKEKAFAINADGVKNLIDACKIHKTVFIHISTDFVFNGKEEKPYLENDDKDPINIYGLSKLKGEEYLQKLYKNFFVIRTSWVYSAYGKNFVKTMLSLSKQKNRLQVVSDQIGSPTYAKDLAEFITKRIIFDSSSEYGIYHYSNKAEISWYDFALEIFHQTRTEIEILPTDSKSYKTKAKRPKYSVLSKNKIEKVFRENIIPWKQSLEKCLKEIKNE